MIMIENSFKINLRPILFGFIRIENFVQIHWIEPWWIGFSQIDFQLIFLERYSECFSDWFRIISNSLRLNSPLELFPVYAYVRITVIYTPMWNANPNATAAYTTTS